MTAISLTQRIILKFYRLQLREIYSLIFWTWCHLTGNPKITLTSSPRLAFKKGCNNFRLLDEMNRWNFEARLLNGNKFQCIWKQNLTTCKKFPKKIRHHCNKNVKQIKIPIKISSYSVFEIFRIQQNFSCDWINIGEELCRKFNQIQGRRRDEEIWHTHILYCLKALQKKRMKHFSRCNIN